MENNVCNGVIRWQISKHVKVVLCIFLLGLTVNEILSFEIFNLEKQVRSLSVNFTMVSFVDNGKYPNHISKFVTLKMYLKVMMYNIRSGAMQ